MPRLVFVYLFNRQSVLRAFTFARTSVRCAVVIVIIMHITDINSPGE